MKKQNNIYCLQRLLSRFAFSLLPLMLGACSNDTSRTAAVAGKDSLPHITLTAAKLRSLKGTTNDPSGDHYTGTPQELQALINAFVADNSKADATCLYIASGTALRLNRPADAGFLFYAAQLRKHLDYMRFGLGKANGNNVQTYLSYLNETEGVPVNGIVLRDPAALARAIEMVQKWNPVPAADALYPKEYYGTPVLPKERWQAIADSDKQSFMDEFARNALKMSKDPKAAEAMDFIKEYAAGKIGRSAANDRKLTEYQQYLAGFYKQ